MEAFKSFKFFAGVSIVASNTSSNDMHMVTSPELLREETTHSIYRKQMLVHSKEGHEDDVHVGSRNSSEGRFSRVSPSKSRTSALSSQLLMSENDVKQRTSNSISEGRAMTPTTFEATSLRLGNGLQN